ncbi:MAG: hypothetical protein LBK62_01665 [Treponema sp.]|jgi:hypothetical protein|nr:hypothetical protein [Treponema sp.]
MAQYLSWLPGGRDDQLAMAKTWLLVLAVKGPGWGVPQTDITDLTTLSQAAETILFQAKSSARTTVITAQCWMAFEAQVEKTRFMKNPGASSWVSSLERKFIVLAMVHTLRWSIP